MDSTDLDDLMRHILTTSDTWAVVGLSDNPGRAAWHVARMLRSHGKRIVPVHPRAESALGVPAYPGVREAAAAVGQIDVVDCFVNSARVGAVVDDAIAVGAGAVWMQLGVIDEEAAARARAAGLAVVMDRCPDEEWPRLMPRG